MVAFSWKWALILMLVMGGFGLQSVHAAATSAGIEVTHLENNAFFRPNEDSDWFKVRAGLVLYPNYELKTMEQTRLTLTLNDGSEVRVAPNSVLRVNPETDVAQQQFDLQLMLGRAWAKFRKQVKVNAKLIIRTAQATIDVHGTSYEAIASTDGTQVRVFTGKVAVSNGQTASYQPSGSLQPTEIAPPHEVSLEQWHVIVDAFYAIEIPAQGQPSTPKKFQLAEVQDDFIQWNRGLDGY